MSEERWQQVVARTPGAEAWVYGVRSTGVFCRPGCPSRRPGRAQVQFFDDADGAVAAGFRACLRCEPLRDESREAELVAGLTHYLAQHAGRAVPLGELAQVAGLAPGTVQRIFMRRIGLSPRAWANARRAEQYRGLLQQGAGTAEAVYAAGFSAPSRAQGAAPLGMTARRYRARGAGERIAYRTGDAGELGRILVAATAAGVCAVFLGANDEELHAGLRERFARAELTEDLGPDVGAEAGPDEEAEAVPDARLGLCQGPRLGPWLAEVLRAAREPRAAADLPLDLRGTAFQARVWAALRAIPWGQTRSYGQLAAELGVPRAVRAVGAACGANPVAIAVPCHRALAASGKLTGYRWGIERKKALLQMESTHERKPHE